MRMPRVARRFRRTMLLTGGLPSLAAQGTPSSFNVDRDNPDSGQRCLGFGRRSQMGPSGVSGLVGIGFDGGDNTPFALWRLTPQLGVMEFDAERPAPPGILTAGLLV